MRALIVSICIGFSVCAFSQTPTVAASNLTWSYVGCNELTLTWTNGNGSDRVVFIRETDAIGEVAQYNEYYTDDTRYGYGESIKNDGKHFCVYRGPGNSVKIRGLKNVTKYCVAIFEYNGGGGIYDYKVDAYPAACVTTKNIVAKFKITSNKDPKDTLAQQCFQGNDFKFTNASWSDITPLTYRWLFGDGDSSNTTNPTHSHKVPGLMQVKLVAQSLGCYATVVVNDTVHPHPRAKFDLDPALLPKNDTVQCFFGNRFTFRNGSTLQDIGVGLSSMRYEWYDMPSTTIFNSAYKADRAFPTEGNKLVKLVVISNKGCRDSSFRKYTVLARAIDPSKVIINPKAMCLSNNLINFRNNSPNSISHKWYFRDSLSVKNDDSASGSTTSYSFGKIGKKYITLVCLDLQGCIDQIRDSVHVFKNSNIGFTGLKDSVCLNSGKLFLKPTPGKGKFFGTANVDQTDSSFNPIATGTFRVGYESVKAGCRDTALATIKVLAKPIIFIGNDTVICKDFPLQLNVSPTFQKINWYYNGNPIGTQPFVNISQSGTYKVSAFIGMCSETDEIQVKSLNAPSIKPFNDTNLCGGSYLRFSLKVDDGTITWNDGNSNGERVIGQSGFYKVFVSNKCGSATDSFTLNVEETACIVFFPNAFSPNGDVLNDVWKPSGKFDFIRMNVYSRWGERVYFSDKSPEWNGYTNDKIACLEGVYNCVFEYMMHEGNTMKRVTQGIPILLIK